MYKCASTYVPFHICVCLNAITHIMGVCFCSASLAQPLFSIHFPSYLTRLTVSQNLHMLSKRPQSSLTSQSVSPEESYSAFTSNPWETKKVFLTSAQVFDIMSRNTGWYFPEKQLLMTQTSLEQKEMCVSSLCTRAQVALKKLMLYTPHTNLDSCPYLHQFGTFYRPFDIKATCPFTDMTRLSWVSDGFR